MSSRIPEPASEFENEGLPDPGFTVAGKEITGDAQEGMEPPRDRPLLSFEYGTTASEEREGEPLDLRLSREEPDVLASADRPADESEGVDDPYPQDGAARIGRIVETDEGAREDDEPTLVAYDAGTDGGGYSAEEAAMHIEPEV